MCRCSTKTIQGKGIANMEDQIRIGVIGAGYWGPKLIRNFHELGETRIEIVADLDEERLYKLQRTFPSVQVTTNYRDLFRSGVVAIVIATPVLTHFNLARESLLNGKHVLVEKPLTASSWQARELVDLASERNLRLMVGHVFEYNPAVQVVRDIIHRGELGQIYFFDMVRATLGLFQEDVNVIWDLAPHDFSILRFVLGCDPISVSARGQAYIRPGVHDVAYITANFPNAVQAHIRVSWLEPKKQRRMTVVGSRKMLVYDEEEPVEKVKIYDVGVEFTDSDRLGAGQLHYRYGDIHSPHVPSLEPLQEECRHFARVIQAGVEARTDGLVGLRIVQYLELADRSLRNQGELCKMDVVDKGVD
jgi:predicted dehydrogenase